MKMVPITSSNVSSIGYSDGNVYVEFHDGSLYCYLSVSDNVYEQFCRASSKGEFVHQHLNYYKYKKVN